MPRRTLSLLALLLALLAIPTAAAAAGFADARGHWAEQFIDRMSAKGVITGYADATFLPDQPVTRAEAIVMIVRALGAEEEARARTTFAPLTNADTIPSWARGYVSEAAERGLVVGSDRSDFRGAEAATRVQVALWIARALSLGDVADAGAATGFRDVSAIPADARGEVEALADRNLMIGDKEGNFRPLDPVTRAEMATLLNRVDRELENDLDERERNGIVEAVGEGVTIALDGGDEVTLTFAADARVYFDGLQAGPGIVAPGDRLESIVDDQGRIVYAEATSEPLRVEGIVTRVDRAERQITLRVDAEGSEETYRVAERAEIWLNGKLASFSDLEAGQSVRLEGQGEEATLVTALSPARTLSGTVARLTFSGERAELRVTWEEEDGEEEEARFTVTATTPLTRDGEPARWGELEEGDLITLEIRGDEVLSAAALPREREIEGTLLRIDYEKDPIRLQIEIDGEAVWFELDSSPRIERNDERVGLTALLPGDSIEAEVDGMEIERIEAESAEGEEAGTLTAITLSDPSTIAVRDEEGEVTEYRLDEDVTVILGDDPAGVRDLQPGHQVSLVLAGDRVIQIRATQPPALNQLSGRIRFIDERERRFVLLLSDGSTRRVEVDDDLLILWNNETSDDFDDLEENDVVVVIGGEEPGRFRADTIVILGREEEDD